jgi:hypothetical protein
MSRPFGVISLFLLSILMAGDAPAVRPELAPNLCTIPLTRVLRIPVSRLGTQGTADFLNAAPATLMISPGATDEPPEGPNGFDVLEDGSLLITDPLRSRVSSFDSDGRFRKAWKIGFRADSLTAIANGLVVVREASTGRLQAFDREGQARPAEAVTLPERVEARVLTGQNRGTVSRPVIDNAHGGPLVIQFDKPGVTLLSLESLANDQKGDTFVALETTASGEAPEAISLNKYVRRYSSDGKLLCEIADIPLDYYVPPVDELRVHKGVVYQLQTTSSEIRVNVWDTNHLCSRPSH